jgi:hypothetical protein
MRSATRSRILSTKRSTIVLIPAYAKTQPLCTYVVTTLTACYIWIDRIRSATRWIILPNLSCTTVLFSAYAKAWPICTYVAPTKYLGFLFFRISKENQLLRSLSLASPHKTAMGASPPAELQTPADMYRSGEWALRPRFSVSDPTYIENHVGDMLHRWHVIN